MNEQQELIDALKKQVDYLKTHLKEPIDVIWSESYGNQVCKYCNESLGNEFKKSAEHRKTCLNIPANKPLTDFHVED